MNNKGFTIVELMIAMAVGLIVIATAYTMISYGSRSHARGTLEYQLQSDMRVAAENINRYIRYSTVTFGVTADDFKPDEGLSKGWDYIGVSPDGERIIHYQYDSDNNTHIENVIVDSIPNMTFETIFVDQDPDTDNKLIYFTLVGVRGGTHDAIAINSELQAINSLQVVDRGHELDKSVALAFRSDERPVAENSHAAVAMVLDVSGSMSWGLSPEVKNPPVGESRIEIMQEKSIMLVESLENSSVSLVPFSSTANNPHDFIDVEVDLDSLKSTINSLDALGGTNTGDGLRRAYYRLDHFNDNKESYNVGGKDILNYMIILVDGVTTFAGAEICAWFDGSIAYGDIVDFVRDDRNIDTSPIYYCYTRGTGTNRFTRNNATGLPSDYDACNIFRIIGHGNNLDAHGEEYVDEMGAMIIASGLDIKVFVIGFSENMDELASVGDIASATGATSSIEGQNYYIATDETELQAIFEDIGGQILADLWHISGP